MTSTLPPQAVPSSTHRATGGRFATGNLGGPGNPCARQTAALRAYLIAHVTERDLQDILDILLLNAKGGHLPTIKFLFSYVLGKPKPVVEPDLLDLQEMEMLRQSSQPPEALETLCDQLPLDLQVQMVRHGQGQNQERVAQQARTTLAAEQDRSEPDAARSTNGDNGEPQAMTPTAPPSTNGENQRRPPLSGSGWPREPSRAARPPDSRSGR